MFQTSSNWIYTSTHLCHYVCFIFQSIRPIFSLIINVGAITPNIHEFFSLIIFILDRKSNHKYAYIKLKTTIKEHYQKLMDILVFTFKFITPLSFVCAPVGIFCKLLASWNPPSGIIEMTHYDNRMDCSKIYAILKYFRK